MSEEPTGTFGELAINAVFRIPLTFQSKCKINEMQAIGLTTGLTYHYPPGEPVRQDAYTEMEQDG